MFVIRPCSQAGNGFVREWNSEAGFDPSQSSFPVEVPHKSSTSLKRMQHSEQTKTMSIEKNLVKSYGISWAEASKVVKGIKTSHPKASPDDVLGMALDELGEKGRAQAEAQVVHEKLVAEQKRQIKLAEDKAAELKRQLEANRVQLLIDGSSLTLPRHKVPARLSEMGVSEETWMVVWDAVYEQLLPAVKQSKMIDRELNHTLEHYRAGQFGRGAVVGGVVGALMEDGHERKTFKKVFCSAHAISGAVMRASNASATANYLLNPHGVLVTVLETSKKYFPKDSKDYFDSMEFSKPIGLEFTCRN